LTTLDNEGHIL